MEFGRVLFRSTADTADPAAGLPGTGDDGVGPLASDAPGLIARAVLPAATFADGPLSGTLISGGLVGGFFPAQPVQGISSLVDARDGTFLAMADNGFGTLDNSADFRLRIYRLRPNFRTATGGAGDIEVESFVELHDPARLLKQTIVNEFTRDRVLTGADFDIE